MNCTITRGHKLNGVEVDDGENGFLVFLVGILAFTSEIMMYLTY
jgi:hypothetical protein